MCTSTHIRSKPTYSHMFPCTKDQSSPVGSIFVAARGQGCEMFSIIDADASPVPVCVFFWVWNRCLSLSPLAHLISYIYIYIYLPEPQVHVDNIDETARSVILESVESGHTAHNISGEVAGALGVAVPSVRMDSQVWDLYMAHVWPCVVNIYICLCLCRCMCEYACLLFVMAVGRWMGVRKGLTHTRTHTHPTGQICRTGPWWRQYLSSSASVQRPCPFVPLFCAAHTILCDYPSYLPHYFTFSCDPLPHLSLQPW